MKKKNTYKKLFNATMATAVAASGVTMVAPSETKASTSFSDVSTNNGFYKEIMNLAERGIIKGYQDGTFRPGVNVTRGQAAKIIAGVLGLDTVNVSNPGFKDVPKTNEYYGAIAALAKAGIINGYGDGTFKPNEPVKRNHMAKIIAGAFKLNATTGYTTPLKDIRGEYEGYITALYEYGVTTGKTKTSFDGLSNVSRGQLAAFVVRAENIVVEKEESVDLTITEISSTVKTTDNTTYTVASHLKGLLNEQNNAALQNAKLKAVVKDNEIIRIDSIELNSDGSQGSLVTFDGQNSTFTGNLTVNADYVQVKNLTVNGNVILTGKVGNEFSANTINITGELIIKEAEQVALASLKPIVANTTNGPSINLQNTSVSRVNVQRDNTEIVSDTKLPEIVVSSKVTMIQLDADVSKFIVIVEVSITVTGTGDIDELAIEKAKAIALEIAGEIAKLTVGDTSATVDVGVNLKIETVVVPEGAQVSSIIKNYDSIKNNISKVETPSGQGAPSNNGGGSSSNNGGTTTPVRYTVTFNIDGKTQSLTTNAEGKITFPVNPTKVGYKFVEWNTREDGKGAVVTAGTVFRANTIVYAIFEDTTAPVITTTATDEDVEVSKVANLNEPTATVTDNKDTGLTATATYKVVTPGATAEDEATEESYDTFAAAKAAATEVGQKIVVTFTAKDVANNEATAVSVTYTVVADQAVDVADLNALQEALANENIKTINITQDITGITGSVKVDRKVTINGGSNTLSFTGLDTIVGTEDDGLIISSDATVNNLTVDAGLGEHKGEWVGTYAIHVYNTKATLTNVKATGGNGGILVNGSDVTLTGTIDVSENGFGGIEVSKGSGLSDPSLDVTGVNWINTSEAYKLPTIWEDKVTGKVNWTEGQFTVNNQVVENQVQYYLKAENAVKTAVDVADLNALQEALANENIKTINITQDITGITGSVKVDRKVTINGGSNTLSFTGLDTIVGTEDDGLIISSDATVNNLTVDAGLGEHKGEWVGTYAIHVYNTKATLTNVKATGGNGGILVNGSDVTLTGTIDVSENGFGGIEVSKGSGLSDPSLDVTGVNWINTSEAYKLPTIWEDKVTGKVNWTEGQFTVNNQVVENQVQYYLKAENAVKTAVDVADLNALQEALANENIKTINITQDITGITGSVKVDRKVTINGGSNTLSFTGLDTIVGTEDDGLIISSDATVNNLTVDAGLGEHKGEWVGTYAIHVYNTKATLTNVKATGGNGGILVNGSDVTLTGTIDVSENGFGGIEVSKGSGLSDPSLDVTGVNWINTSEAYKLPTIWEDKVTGKVNWTEGQFTVNNQVVENQVQYYLRAENADGTEVGVIDTNGLQGTLANKYVNQVAEITVLKVKSVATTLNLGENFVVQDGVVNFI
ncbi:S-layer homology domain-containing protein [Lysinibacillus endophyticus]|uniref:S-layer homology domain-containing protein n=1 Tax=Ureibacillus endophyticus TaxID=1978490 RepID=UPI003134DD6F